MKRPLPKEMPLHNALLDLCIFLVVAFNKTMIVLFIGIKRRPIRERQLRNTPLGPCMKRARVLSDRRSRPFNGIERHQHNNTRVQRSVCINLEKTENKLYPVIFVRHHLNSLHWINVNV